MQASWKLHLLPEAAKFPLLLSADLVVVVGLFNGYFWAQFCLPNHLFLSLPPSIYLSIYLSIYISIYLSIYIFISLCINRRLGSWCQHSWCSWLLHILHFERHAFRFQRPYCFVVVVVTKKMVIGHTIAVTCYSSRIDVVAATMVLWQITFYF